MERDYQLDIYRALSMIYVVCVIHVLYWLKLGCEPWISVILFEMPVIFFVSGASLSFNKNPRSVLSTLKSRFLRVMLPYYIYAIMMVLVVVVVSVICKLWYSEIEHVFGSEVLRKHMCDITQYTWNDVVKIISGTDIPQAPYVWHIWFILPYMILSCTFDIQKKILIKINRGGYLLACIMLFVATNIFPVPDIIREVCCYNVFMVIGYCYYKNCRRSLIITAAIISLIAILVMLFVYDMDFCAMQGHKFPPDVFFLTYGIFALCILSLFFGSIKIPQTKLLNLWHERGYTIYLYQSIVFFFVYAVCLVVIKKIPLGIVQIVVSTVLMLILSTLASYPTYKLEVTIVCKLKSAFQRLTSKF